MRNAELKDEDHVYNLFYDYSELRKPGGFKGAEPPELGGSKGGAAPLCALFAYFLSRDRK